MTILRSPIRSALRSPLRGALEDKFGGSNPLTISRSGLFVDLFSNYPLVADGQIVFADSEDDGSGIYTATMTVPALKTITSAGWTGSGGASLTINDTLANINAAVAAQLDFGSDAAAEFTNTITLVRDADSAAASPRNVSISAYAPLALTDIVPVDNATGVSDHADIVATFSRPVQFGTGNIILRENDGGFANYETFDVGTAVDGVVTGTPNGFTLTLDNDTNTISTGGQNLTDLTEYAIRIAATAIDGALLGTADSYAGIANDTTWSFTTGIDMTIAITPMEANKVWQREAGSTSATVSFAGTYADGTPSGIAVRVLRESDDAVIVNWTQLAGETIGGGSWSGTLSVPQGTTAAEKFYIQARDTIQAGITAEDTTAWSVGIVIVGYGQSNWLFHMTTTSSPEAAAIGTYAFVPTGGQGDTSSLTGAWTSSVPTGNGIRKLLNDLSVEADIPIGIVWAGASGVPISYLVEGGEGAGVAYDTLEGRITNSGGDAEFITFHQGEGDAAIGTGQASWQASLDALHGSLTTLTGRTKAQMPIAISGLSETTAAQIDDGEWETQNRSLFVTATNLANVYYSHTNLDAILVDEYHWNAASYERSGARYTQQIAVLLGTETNNTDWGIASAAEVDTETTDVTLTHSLGTDFTPTSGITGFETTDDNWVSTLAISAAVRQTATVVRLTHATASATREVRYQYGESFDLSGAVKDNSSFSAPLRQGLADIAVTPAGGGAPSQQDIINLGPLAFWSLDDLTDVWEQTGRTTNVSTDGDTLAAIDDLSGNGYDFDAPSGKECEYDITTGVKSWITDGADNGSHLLATLPTAGKPTDCSWFYTVKTTDANAVHFHSSNTAGLVVHQDGAATTPTPGLGSPSIYVDGVVLSAHTRDAFHDAIADGNWHVVEIRNADLQTASSGFYWNTIRSGFFASSGFGMAANFSDALIITTTLVETGTNRADIIAWLEAQVGL